METKNLNRLSLKPFQSTKVQTKLIVLESSPLRRLPDSIILCIAEYLSPASKLAFCRAYRRACSVIGTQHLSSADVCKAQDLAEDRKPPWEVLELEYPNHIECYYCRDLHPIDKMHDYAHFEANATEPCLPQRKRFSDNCWKMNHRVRTAKFLHPKFSFTVFRMIMKQHRQGKDCDELLDFLAYRSGAVMEGAQVQQVVVTPKIVGDRLLLRSQTAYLIPPKGPIRKYLIGKNLLKCPHTNKWIRDNRIVTERLRQSLAALETSSGGRQEHLISSQCSFCPTEFHVTLEKFEEREAVLFITKWQDLGAGLSPLHSDLPTVVGRYRDISVARQGEKVVYKSPRDRFEGLAPGEGPKLYLLLLTRKGRTYSE